VFNIQYQNDYAHPLPTVGPAYPIQQVGAREHTEYWIPAEELAEFNDHIVGLVEVVDSFS
jgi:hypothetical protein